MRRPLLVRQRSATFPQESPRTGRCEFGVGRQMPQQPGVPSGTVGPVQACGDVAELHAETPHAPEQPAAQQDPSAYADLPGM